MIQAPVEALAVTEVRMTVAPVLVFLRVALTMAPGVAVPLRVGVSMALMMSSVAMPVLMITSALGKNELSIVTEVAALAEELKPPSVCLAVTLMLPLPPKVATSAEVSVDVSQLVPLTVAVLVTVTPLLPVKNTLTLAPFRQVPLVVAVLPVTSLRLMVLSPATDVMVGAPTVMSTMAEVAALGEELKPPSVCLAVTLMSPFPPKVATSAEVSVVVIQLVPVTVAVLVTVAPLLPVKNTLTLAPFRQVPLVVAVLPVTSLRLIVLSPATDVMVGAATTSAMVML